MEEVILNRIQADGWRYSLFQITEYLNSPILALNSGTWFNFLSAGKGFSDGKRFE